jgi:hypothetical protein
LPSIRLSRAFSSWFWYLAVANCDSMITSLSR